MKEEPYSREVGAGTSSSPKVSVACITYRHEAYIAQAIEGVLMQQIDFPIEFLIGEDCSPDGTRGVILEYSRKHPGLIRLSDYSENLGSSQNFRTTIGRCRGEYVAYLDGDDYWIAPDKLRKQVELMDAHPEYSLCAHAMKYKYEDRAKPPWPVYPPGRRPVYRLADCATWLRMAPSSFLFRRSCLPEIPRWLDEVFFGDWMLQVLLAEKGDIGYIDEVMGVKRLHGESELFGSALKDKGKHLENIANECEFFCRHLGDERATPFAHKRDEVHYDLVHHYLEQGDEDRARKLFRDTYKSAGGYNPRVTWREPMLWYVHLYAPKVYRLLRQVWRETWHRTAWHRAGAFSDAKKSR